MFEFTLLPFNGLIVFDEMSKANLSLAMMNTVEQSNGSANA
jgi:hypothetical protein